MNNLSWLIYSAHVAGSLRNVLLITFIAFFVISCVIFIQGSNFRDDAPTRNYLCDDTWIKGVKLQVKAAKLFLLSLFICLVPRIIIPSEDTIYAIAASETGEQALKSPIATKIGKSLENWLDKQLSEEEPTTNQVN